jgi:hypothetical protein
MREGEVFAGAKETIWNLVSGLTRKTVILSNFSYVYVLYFAMQSATEWDFYILWSMKYVFTLLPCLKSHGLVSSIG